MKRKRSEQPGQRVLHKSADERKSCGSQRRSCRSQRRSCRSERRSCRSERRSCRSQLMSGVSAQCAALAHLDPRNHFLLGGGGRLRASWCGQVARLLLHRVLVGTLHCLLTSHLPPHLLSPSSLSRLFWYARCTACSLQLVLGGDI